MNGQNREERRIINTLKNLLITAVAENEKKGDDVI